MIDNIIFLADIFGVVWLCFKANQLMTIEENKQ
jgi:hypothetical protein